MIDKNLSKIIGEEGNYHSFMIDGYQCTMTRHQKFLHWCGYLHIKYGHPLYRKLYNDPVFDDLENFELTYSAFADGAWTIGFDCAQTYDWVPAFEYPFPEGITYKTKDFVKARLEALVKYVKEREKKMTETE